MPLGLVNLPWDILHAIISKDELKQQDLKNLRPTHSTFSAVVIPKLLGTVRVNFYEKVPQDYGQRLFELLQSPVSLAIRSHVRCLGIQVDTALLVEHSGSPITKDELQHQKTVFSNFLDALEKIQLWEQTDGSFAKLNEIRIDVDCACAALNMPCPELSRLFGIVKALTTMPKDCGDRNRIDVSIKISGLQAHAHTNATFMDDLPPMDKLLMSGGFSYTSALVRAFRISPKLRELDISQSAYVHLLDELITKLEQTEALRCLRSLRLMSLSSGPWFKTETDISRFQYLKGLRVTDRSGPMTNFPWDAARRMNMKLEVIEVQDMDRLFVDYLKSLEEDSVKIVKTTFQLPAAKFDTPPTIFEEQRALAIDLWATVRRFQNSLVELSIMPMVKLESYDEDPDADEFGFYIYRMDASLPWSPLGQEFANANLRFTRLEEIEGCTSYAPRLGTMTTEMSSTIASTGIDPTKFRLDGMMKALLLSLRTLRCITITNICGRVQQMDPLEPDPFVYETEPEYEEYMAECIEFVDLTGSMGSMVSHTEDFRFDTSLKIPSGTVRLTLALEPEMDYAKLVFVLNGGRFYKQSRTT